MSTPALEILDLGMGVTMQDLGRPGWKHLGIPASGVMDRHSAMLANRLVGNPEHFPVLECLLHRARFRALRSVRIGITGAGAPDGISTSMDVEADSEINIRPKSGGIWTYLSVGGEMKSARFLGSASAYPRGGIGRPLRVGDRISCDPGVPFPGIARRMAAPCIERNFLSIPRLQVWPGPQREQFPAGAWDAFFATVWTVSSRSDRVGYRLDGGRIEPPAQEMRSEPMVVGSVQVPPDGQPVVTLRDGPTVGGYPKLAVIDDASLDWLAQVSPGVEFRMVCR